MDGWQCISFLQISHPRAPLCYFSIMYTHIPNKRQKCRSGKSMSPTERVFVQIKGDARGKQSIILQSEFVAGAHKERQGAPNLCVTIRPAAAACLPLIFRLFGKLDRNLAARTKRRWHTWQLSRGVRGAKVYLLRLDTEFQVQLVFQPKLAQTL